MTDTRDREPIGSYIRWQGYRIGQLTIATNLILGLSVAALGFLVTLILNPENHSQLDSLLARLGVVVSMLFVGGSIVLGVWLVLNRMGSFRATARVARLKEENEPKAEIDTYRFRYKAFDGLTWYLFYSQVWAFAIGIALAFLSIVLPAASAFLSCNNG